MKTKKGLQIAVRVFVREVGEENHDMVSIHTLIEPIMDYKDVTVPKGQAVQRESLYILAFQSIYM